MKSLGSASEGVQGIQIQGTSSPWCKPLLWSPPDVSAKGRHAADSGRRLSDLPPQDAQQA
jgi:hypothetical protein